MASTSSREAALERRRALTNGGKKAASRFTSGASRVRSVEDARPTRTAAAQESPGSVAKAAPVAAPAVNARAAASHRSLAAPTGSSRTTQARPIANPSRDLVLARREALSKRGKRADTSSDRTRTDLAKIAQEVQAPVAEVKSKGQGEIARRRPSPRGQTYPVRDESSD